MEFSVLTEASINSLQSVQNAPVRLLTDSQKSSYISPLLTFLHWLSVRFRVV